MLERKLHDLHALRSTSCTACSHDGGRSRAPSLLLSFCRCRGPIERAFRDLEITPTKTTGVGELRYEQGHGASVWHTSLHSPLPPNLHAVYYQYTMNGSGKCSHISFSSVFPSRSTKKVTL